MLLIRKLQESPDPINSFELIYRGNPKIYRIIRKVKKLKPNNYV